MTEERYGLPLKKYRESDVVLVRGNERLEGVQWFEYLVDTPPVIEASSTGTRWYRSVWEQRGWTVQ